MPYSDLEQLDLIDLAEPLEPEHPLNLQRAVWLITLPGLDGSPKWYDVAGLSHGTLTGGPSWKAPQGRPGGWGSLALDGVDDYVSTFLAASSLGVNYSAAAWVRPASGSNVLAYFSLGTHSLINISTTAWRWQYDNGAFPFVGATVTSRGPNEWHRYCVVSRGTAAGDTDLYMDGVSVGAGQAISQALAGTTARLGQEDPLVAGRYLLGNIDDFSAWSRALAPAEVKLDYALSRLGYPGVIRRQSLFELLSQDAPAAVGGFSSSWARHAQVVGGGVL